MTQKQDIGVWTKNDVWCIHNYTRYSTEDFLTLFNLVEEAILLQDENVQRPGADSIADFYIDTYTITEGDPVKDYGPVNELRIRPPAHIGMSPIDVLGASLNSSKEGTPIPTAIVSKILLRLLRNYASGHSDKKYILNHGGWLYTSVIQYVLRKSPIIRFFDRVENKRPVSESGQLRLMRFAQEKARRAGYTTDSALSRIKNLEKEAKMLNKHLRRIGQDPIVDEDKLEEIKAFLTDTYTRVKNKEDNLHSLLHRSKI